MKIFILAPRENWIIDRISQEFVKAHPGLVVDNPYEADLVWAAAGWCWNHLPADILQNKKILLTVHHEVPEKFAGDRLNSFLVRDQFVDQYHVPAQKTKDFISSYTNKNINVLSYWYDGEVWTPEDKLQCRSNLGLPTDKFIIGSFQRDTEGSDLITPKLEKGPDVFCDYVEKLSKEKDVHVLLGGWRRQYVINRLNESNVPFTYFELAPLDQLQQMYGSCDLYVVGSRHEGGPQSILEASAMKVPIISTDVGIASAVLAPNCVFDVSSKMYTPTEEDVNECFERVQAFELKSYTEKYIDLFRKVVESP